MSRFFVVFSRNTELGDEIGQLAICSDTLALGVNGSEDGRVRLIKYPKRLDGVIKSGKRFPSALKHHWHTQVLHGLWLPF